MATKKKMIKKLIITTNLRNIGETNFIQKTTGIAQAVQNNPTVVPTLTPAATIVLTKIQKLSDLHIQRDNLRNAQKQNTEQIHQEESEIINIITGQWAPQVQQAIAGDESKAKLLGFGIRGLDSGHADNSIGKAAVSHPIINHIDTNVHLQQTLYTLNSVSRHNKLPKDAKQINIYMQIGGTEPTDIKQMQYAGIAKRGKFINNFKSTDVGKLVYYIAVYIDKKTFKPLEQGSVASAIVN